ncbi:Na+/H+ antiporter [Deinococcus sp. UYEF24]
MPALQVIAGLVLGLLPGFPVVEVRPEIVFLLLVPPLLYSAGYNTSWRDFQASLPSISLLAVGLVLVTVVGVAWAAHVLAGLDWGPAFVLGAVVSPTDAVAATSLSAQLRLPSRALQVLEGEGLLNDATGLTVFNVAVAVVISGHFSWGLAAWQLVQATGLGLLAGLGIGWLDGWLRRLVGRRSPPDPLVSTGLSLITPFAAYLVGEGLHGSGVLAVVTAGLYLGRHESSLTSVQGRLNAAQVWGLTTELLNGFAFLLIGLQLPRVLGTLRGMDPLHTLLATLGVALSVVVIRLVWIFPTTYFLSQAGWLKGLLWKNVLVVGWTGSRGVLSLAAALSLPAVAGQAFPQQQPILLLTFTVILLTLVGQGLTLPALIRALRLESDEGPAREEYSARLAAAEAARTRLRNIAEHEPQRRGRMLESLTARYDAKLGNLEHGSGDRGSTGEYESLERDAISAQRSALHRLRDDGTINDAILRLIEHDLDVQESQLGEVLTGAEG